MKNILFYAVIAMAAASCGKPPVTDIGIVPEPVSVKIRSCGKFVIPEIEMPGHTLAAMAENGWSYDRKDYDGFTDRMDVMRRLYDLCGYNYAKHIFDE